MRASSSADALLERRRPRGARPRPGSPRPRLDAEVAADRRRAGWRSSTASSACSISKSRASRRPRSASRASARGARGGPPRGARRWRATPRAARGTSSPWPPGRRGCPRRARRTIASRRASAARSNSSDSRRRAASARSTGAALEALLRSRRVAARSGRRRSANSASRRDERRRARSVTRGRSRPSSASGCGHRARSFGRRADRGLECRRARRAAHGELLVERRASARSTLVDFAGQRARRSASARGERVLDAVRLDGEGGRARPRRRPPRFRPPSSRSRAARAARAASTWPRRAIGATEARVAAAAIASSTVERVTSAWPEATRQPDEAKRSPSRVTMTRSGFATATSMPDSQSSATKAREKSASSTRVTCSGAPRRARTSERSAVQPGGRRRRRDVALGDGEDQARSALAAQRLEGRARGSAPVDDHRARPTRRRRTRRRVPSRRRPRSGRGTSRARPRGRR